jgi:hypothetical protein
MWLLKDINHPCSVNANNHTVWHPQHCDILDKVQMALQELLLLQADNSASR